MAVGKRILDRGSSGRRITRNVEITFDNAYATGGKPIVPGDFEMSGIELLEFSHAIRNGAHSTDQARYDGVGGKLQLFTIAGAELANASDQSLLKVYCRVIGRR